MFVFGTCFALELVAGVVTYGSEEIQVWAYKSVLKKDFYRDSIRNRILVNDSIRMVD